MIWIANIAIIAAALSVRLGADEAVFAGGDLSPERLTYWGLLAVAVAAHVWALRRASS